MAASDYVPTFKNRLHLAGRPQMSTRPSSGGGRPCRRVHVTDAAIVKWFTEAATFAAA